MINLERIKKKIGDRSDCPGCNNNFTDDTVEELVTEIDSLCAQLTEANALIAEGKSVADLQHKAIQEYRGLLSEAKEMAEYTISDDIEGVYKYARAKAHNFLKKLESKNGA